ncbi:hypothetical protein BDF21DRAFT_148207 [Thamnidium elegans]|nr:hypothetical protein BDF21DRAFT_148207 [Thamnidium elegans]
MVTLQKKKKKKNTCIIQSLFSLCIETATGFTIEYKKYYKVLTNKVANKRYCLVGWKLPTPEDCNEKYTLATPVERFSFDDDFISVGPFIEVSKTHTLLYLTDFFF